MPDEHARVQLPAAPAAISQATGPAKPVRHAPPTAAAADKIIAAKAADPGAAGSATIDLGDQIVGGQTVHDTIVWNLETTDAVVTAASIEGSPALQLLSNPSQLRPSRDGFDPASAFQIQFSPTARGAIHGAFHVSLSWPSGEHAPVELRAPIEGGAHEDGAMTLAGEAAEQRDLDARRRAAADRAAQETREAANEQQRLKAQRLHGTPFWLRELDEARNDTTVSLGSLYERRRIGVNMAENEISLYTKQEPRHDASLIEALATVALEIATAGIAGYLAKRLEGPLNTLLASKTDGKLVGDRVEHLVVEEVALVAIVTDGIKQGVKSLGKPRTPSAPGADDRDPPAAGPTMLSIDPLADFLARQRLELVDQSSAEAGEVTRRARNRLEPMLDTQPETAVAAMRKIKSTIDETNADAVPAVEQANATARSWMQYVAQASLGSVTAGEARAEGKRTPSSRVPLTQIDNAVAPPTDHGGPASVRGLIDLEFAASVSRADAPARLRRVYIEGISHALAVRLANHTLLSSGLAARAHGVSTDGDAVMPVTVARDEAGNLAFTDDTRAPGSQGASWLARKAGAHADSRDAQARGARILMEAELMNQPIDTSLIATDSGDNPR